MKKVLGLILTFLFLNNVYAYDYSVLDYGPFEKYFELGEVDFFRATGFLGDREADYDVVVKNNYPVDICLVPTMNLIKNGRVDFLEPSFILGPNEEVELGHYGAESFGSSWRIKWDYFISANLEYCAI